MLLNHSGGKVRPLLCRGGMMQLCCWTFPASIVVSATRLLVISVCVMCQFSLWSGILGGKVYWAQLQLLQRARPGAGVTPHSAVTLQLLSVCFRVSARVNMTTDWDRWLEKCIMVAMQLSEDMDSRFRFLHLPIIPSAFHFGVLKTLKKEEVQSVRSIRCCSTWQLYDEQHEQSPRQTHCLSLLSDGMGSYFLSSVSQLYWRGSR